MGTFHFPSIFEMEDLFAPNNIRVIGPSSSLRRRL
jgi:hypothetical protein